MISTTPLMAAAGCGTYSPGEDPGIESEALEAVKLAWELGGDVNAVDEKGNTAMHGAAYKFFPSVVRFLAEKGARVEIFNLQDEFGFDPLTIAEGVLRAPTGNGDHFRVSEETAAAIREVMKGAARWKRRREVREASIEVRHERGSRPRTAPPGAHRNALVTAHGSAPGGAAATTPTRLPRWGPRSVRGHPLLCREAARAGRPDSRWSATCGRPRCCRCRGLPSAA